MDTIVIKGITLKLEVIRTYPMPFMPDEREFS